MPQSGLSRTGSTVRSWIPIFISVLTGDLRFVCGVVPGGTEAELSELSECHDRPDMPGGGRPGGGRPGGTVSLCRVRDGVLEVLRRWLGVGVVVWFARVVVAVAFVGVGMVNATRLFGWCPVLVTAEAMEPSISAGDVVVTAPVDLQTARGALVGQVVRVRSVVDPSTSYLGRITRTTPAEHPAEQAMRAVKVVTRADALGFDDAAVGQDQLLGQVRMRLPAIGRPVVALYDGDPLPLTSAAAVLAILLWLAFCSPGPAPADLRPPRPGDVDELAAHGGRRSTTGRRTGRHHRGRW